MQPPQPQKEHEWLAQLVGDWTFEAECVMGPDQPPSKHGGTETVRSIGGLWMECEGKGEAPGCGIATNIMTLGYDPDKKRFVGTFTSSMMTHLWIYDGQLVGNVLTLDTTGPSFAGDGKMVPYQDSIEFINKDHRTLSSQTPGPDGKWVKFMTGHYRRKK